MNITTGTMFELTVFQISVIGITAVLCALVVFLIYIATKLVAKHEVPMTPEEQEAIRKGKMFEGILRDYYTFPFPTETKS